MKASTLEGRRVLIVEDEYFLANDLASALENAGATIARLCPTEEEARIGLNEQQTHAVVLDINLGQGPSFELAAYLKDKGIPFVFVTGYDLRIIPEEFASVECLHKPVQTPRALVEAISRSVAKAAQSLFSYVNSEARVC